jgi:hypothetical protein
VQAPGAPGWLRELPAVAVLRMIWVVQQYYRVIDERGEKVIRREATEHGVPLGRLKLVSPTIRAPAIARSAARAGRATKSTSAKPAMSRNRTAPGRAPNLITSVAATEATVPDAAMTEPVHDSMAAAGLLPAEHVVDAGCT